MVEFGAILAGEAARTVAAAALGAGLAGAGKLLRLLRSRIPGLSRRAAEAAPQIEAAIRADPAFGDEIAAALAAPAATAPALPDIGLPEVFYDRSAVRERLAAPGVWIVGGSPGAGKTAVLARVGADLAATGAAVAYLDLDLGAYRLGDQLDVGAAQREILRQLGLPAGDGPPRELSERYHRALIRGRYVLLLDNARDDTEAAALVVPSPVAHALVSTRRIGAGFRAWRPLGIVGLGGLDPDGGWEMFAARVPAAALAAEPDAARRLLDACDHLPEGIRQVTGRLTRRAGEPGAIAAELAEIGTGGLDGLVERSLADLPDAHRDAVALLLLHPGDGFTRAGAAALLGGGAVAGPVLAALDDLSLLDRAAGGLLRLPRRVRDRPHLLPAPPPATADAALLRLLEQHVALGVAADTALTSVDRLRPYAVEAGDWALPVPPLDWLVTAAGTLFALVEQARHRDRHADVLRLCGTLEVLLLHRGEHERCDRAFTHGVASAAALGDLLAQARLTSLRGRIALLGGRLDAAADHLDAARNLLTDARAAGLDTARFDSSLAEFRARLAEERGDPDAAIALFRAAIAADEDARWWYSLGIHARMLANALVRVGSFAAALGAADLAARHTTDQRNLGRVHTVRAKALAGLAAAPEQLAAAPEQLAAAPEQLAAAPERRAAHLAAASEQRAAHLAAARAALAAARSATGGSDRYAAELDEVDAEIALAGGRPDAARACWSRNIERAQHTGDSRLYDRTLRRLAAHPPAPGPA